MFLVAGRINIDTIIEIDEDLVVGRKYVGRIVLEDVGGTGANIATAIKRYCRNCEVVLMGSIGTDYREFVLNKLIEEGIDVSLISVEDTYTGRAFIYIDRSKEAIIITIPGANEIYRIETIALSKKPTAIVIGNTARSTALKLIELANKFKAKLFIDPGKSWFLKEDMSLIDTECFYLPNIHEFRYTFSDSIDSVEWRCTPIIKMGSKGSIAIAENSVIRVYPVPVEKLGLAPKSTAGCGDIFTGVFAASYIEYGDVFESLRRATVAASIKMSRVSSRDAPYRADVEEKLRRLIDENAIRIDICDIGDLKKLLQNLL